MANNEQKRSNLGGGILSENQVLFLRNTAEKAGINGYDGEKLNLGDNKPKLSENRFP